jgi:gluconolactonase
MKSTLRLLGALTLLAAACPPPMAKADSPMAPPLSVGGHILGLQAICGDCTPQKFATGFQDILEGPVFGRDGNLYLLSILKANIWQITPSGKASIFLHLPDEIKYPSGLRFAADGTLYGVAMGSGLFSVDMPSKKVTLVTDEVTTGGIPDGAFHGLDDLFIDHEGGMYLTDAAGSSVLNPIGQLLYRDPSGNITRLVSTGLAFPNGVVLSPDEKTLYVDEWASDEIIAIPVISPGVISPGWSYVFARLNGGHGPDSMTADADGNIYAAHYGSGEVAVFAPNGDYYGAIQLPPGAGSFTTNVVIHDGWLYMTEGQKGEVWRVKTKIPGIKLYGGQ